MKAEGAGLIAVIDTNVWISGFLSKAGAPAFLTRQVVSYGRPVFTLATFAELQERLWRPKFDRYLSLEHRKQLLRDIDAAAFWANVPPEIEQKTFSRDPDDDKFIHAALATNAPWLVTGDQDLLVLANALQSLGVKILSPADALQLPNFQIEP
ncbi:putative toxin-antitoxin system toxin component, PIN family [Methylicorpusculum oleiharenae]|uniref:putative toxin-antitoxin system toxin component, PIN family n=1 Tax=Methylicorpusculum oleiharenae TaxID=1338687 RepID=UPI00135CC287|nr:putative toxin-antitoxin system toxin component, PIN family [Methylicorpusculum oleiharenae]MCD2451099.1 putative toxin-antitoxin system toxin component, PIN family [Methylicorpusculum oleiharenae]